MKELFQYPGRHPSRPCNRPGGVATLRRIPHGRCCLLLHCGTAGPRRPGVLPTIDRPRAAAPPGRFSHAASDACCPPASTRAEGRREWSCHFSAAALRAQHCRPIEAFGQASCSVWAGVTRPSGGDGMDSAVRTYNALALKYLQIHLLSGSDLMEDSDEQPTTAFPSHPAHERLSTRCMAIAVGANSRPCTVQ